MLSLLGFTINYHGDAILIRWPWLWAKKSKYLSTHYSRDFNSFREYWEMAGAEKTLIKLSSTQKKLQGYGLSYVLGRWSAAEYPEQPVVVLTDIDRSAKGPGFWSRLRNSQAQAFTQDVVVLRCKDRDEMVSLIEGISPEFSTAFGFINGQLIDTNMWGD